MKLGLYIGEKIRGLYAKMIREKAPPEYIARGWAIGMFFGCFAPIGMQLTFSIPCSFLLKGSKVGAIFGTLLTNHITIFFIYPVQCWIGNRILGGSLTMGAVRDIMDQMEEKNSWALVEALWELKREIVAAFFTGGLLFALILTPITYYLVLMLVKQHRARISARKRKLNKTKG